MRKIFVAAALVLAGLGIAFGARAGYRWDFDQVVIEDDAPWAEGMVSAVRTNSDSVSYIGCHVYGGTADAYQTVTCMAQDPYVGWVSCWTAGPADGTLGGLGNRGIQVGFVQTAHAISGDSFIHFEWSYSDYHCTNLVVYNYSQYPAKRP